jgi:ADP-ribose pyrophosphatase YjhB (NUDIX family)
MSDFAHFDRDDPLEDALCLSAFLVSWEKGGLLVGRMRDPKAWETLDAVPGAAAWRADRWVLPGGHLRAGEHPDAAARRIAADHLRAVLGDLSLRRVLSYAEPRPDLGQAVHWDLCFVYDAELDVAGTPPWFAELRRVDLEDLRRERFARGHGDVLADLGLLPSP